MASLTYDGQSFMIDGRRVWLVGGSVAWWRVPRAEWEGLVQAARRAGLNALAVPVVWSRHEPRAGHFDWSGENDLRHLVELIGRAGMHCLLRVGPYVGEGLDLGGLPAWLLTLRDVALRTSNTAFLEATSRYLGALARQVRDLQATAPRPGPILAVQPESAWTCGDDALARAYLGELDRYLRESGFDVPIINNHRLWQSIEGEVDAWTGDGQMLTHLRQLGHVRPGQPRLVTELHIAHQGSWGGEAPRQRRMSPVDLERCLAEVMAAGGQFIVQPLHAAQVSGFLDGRGTDSAESFLRPFSGREAPLDEALRPTPLMRPLRRAAMFASRFARVLAHLDPRQHPVAPLPDSLVQPRHGAAHAPRAKAPPREACVVVHRPGSQGSVVFVFGAPGHEQAPAAPIPLLLPDGSTVTVHLGSNATGWYLLDTRLAGRSHLDWCNLTPFALVGRVLVVAGPAGTPAEVCINGSPLMTHVPGARAGRTPPRPEIFEHEGIVVVICSDQQLDRVHVTDEAVFYGGEGLTPDGLAIVHRDDEPVLRIGADGAVTDESLRQYLARRPKLPPAPPAAPAAPTPSVRGKAGAKAGAKGAPARGRAARTPAVVPPPVAEPPPAPPPLVLRPPHRHAAPPHLEAWRTMDTEEYADGTSPRFASIDAPADLNALGAPYGYGWYRVVFKPSSAGRTQVAWPHAGDRLHLFLDGHAAGVLGAGPGAVPEVSLNLKRQTQTLVVLAENFGRFCAGQRLAEPKGVHGHLWEVHELRLARPQAHRGEPLSPLALMRPLFGVHESDVTEPQRACWQWEGRRRGAVQVRLAAPERLPGRALLLLNNEVLSFVDASGPASVVIEPDRMSRGHNRVELAFLAQAGVPERVPAMLGALAELVTFHECRALITEGGAWAFAKWEQPGPTAFHREPRTARHVGPAWYRTEFTAPEHPEPLRLDVSTLTKGQAYLNGRHLGRYFSQTARHAPVGPLTSLCIPAELQTPRAVNELVLFDEHAAHPARVRLVSGDPEAE
jgi:hypothetical protein